MIEHTPFEKPPEVLAPVRKRLAFAVTLTAIVFLAELIGGLWTHSLALLSDAAHVFTDLVSLMLSFGALVIASRPVTKERTYGWHRLEIFAALINGLFLCVVVFIIIREAYSRFFEPHEVRVTGMLLVALGGLIANAIILSRLRGHAHHDINVRSAFLHVAADFISSIGVVIAALIMLATRWYLVDPILSVVIALIVLAGAIRLLREVFHILLEGVPRHVDLHEVAEMIKLVPGVEDIHDLHIWTICSNLLALSVHVTVGDRSAVTRDEIVKAINDQLRLRYDIVETTIQTEREPCRTSELIHLASHQDESH